MAVAAAAAPVPPHMLPGHGAHRRRFADDLMIDMNQLMEAVREEVTALMLDGVHKTASLCASTCAQHVVAARRQMHQRLKGRNGGTTPNSMPTPTNSTGFLGLTPRQHLRALPRVAAVEARGAPATASNMPRPIPIYTPVPGCSLDQAAADDDQNDVPGAFVFAGSRGATPPNLTPRMTPSTNGVFPDSLDSSMAYDTLVDTRDAVQSLEDKTRMASRAMELIEEAIKVATDVADVAGTPPAAGQQCREDLRTDIQPAAPEEPGVSTPRESPALPRGDADPKEETDVGFMQQVHRETQELQERLKQLDGSSDSRPPSRPPSRRGERSSSPQPIQGASAKHVRGLSPGGVAVTTHKVAGSATDSEPQEESQHVESLLEKAKHGLAHMLHLDQEKKDEGMPPAQDGHGKASAPAAPMRLAPLPAAGQAMASNGVTGTEHADPAIRQRESEHSNSQAVHRERSTASTYSSADSIPAMELTGS